MISQGTLAVSDRFVYARAGRRVEVLSVAWTSLEALVGIVIGWLAGSTALVGFGGDSIIEAASSCILLWSLTDWSPERDRFAHRLVGICFLTLAVYISFDASVHLAHHDAPHATAPGMFYAIACVLVMPMLARAKRRVAAQLGSHALHADSHQSDVCAWLCLILLIGLALNAVLHWWWADAVAALCMLPIILREGITGVRGESCSHAHW